VTVRLNAVLDGPQDAPVLVLGSSLGTTAAMWDPQVPSLARRFRVLRYEHRGHGGSPAADGSYTIAELADDVLALLDDHGVTSFRYAGLSLGGMVGMELAARVPERVERLALLCTSAMLGPPEFWAARAEAVRAGGMEAVADGVLARWFTPAFAEASPDVVAWLRGMLVSTAPAGYAGCCDAIGGMDLRGRLGAIRAATLVVAGAEDPATPPDHGRAIADAVPGARIEVVPGAAHIANVERPGEVTDLLLAHLDPAGAGHAG
jgi:3-oxoadipate enol-lactonase